MLFLHHRVSLREPHTHLVHVETTVESDGSLPASLTLFMPVWTPGSYLVREYARHVEDVRAAAPASVEKIRKNAWRVTPGAGGARSVTVRYRVYCNELTVRTNHVDDTHALLNGAALLLAVEGEERAKARVSFDLPDGWRIATSLARDSGGDGNDFVAPDLDTLVDCPIAAGPLREDRFEVLGKPHTLSTWPASALDGEGARRLVEDTTTILATEAKLFGGALPYDAYEILLHLSPRGRGGLEHMSSCTLLASPASFASRDGYVDLLSLVAHEVFHAWNVKRIRPAGLTPYRYQEENYTRLLWWFEGATSYYDWRVLRLAKLCTVAEYTDHLAQEIAYLDATHGRLVHPLEEASFDAWIKLYRPDENSQNSTVSYYRKGEVVIALLDLEIRARSAGKKSLDDVLSHLWTHHGARGVPVPEGGMGEIMREATGVDLRDRLDAWVRSAREIDYDEVLASVGLRVERAPRETAPQVSLGVRVRGEGGRVAVASVLRGGAAERAGVDPGDEIVGIAGHRTESTSFDAALRGRTAGDVVDVLVARDGRLLSKAVSLDPARPERVKLVPRDDAGDASRAAFAAWLGDPLPAAKEKDREKDKEAR